MKLLCGIVQILGAEGNGVGGKLDANIETIHLEFLDGLELSAAQTFLIESRKRWDQVFVRKKMR